MSRVARLLIALALVFVALPLLTAAGGGNGTSDTARAEHQRIIDFWTPERVAQAEPRDIVFDVAQGRFRLADPAHHRPGHPGGPGGEDPGGDGGTTVTGASWEGGGAIAENEGKVLFQLGVDAEGKPQFWVCSATVVTDSRSGESLVLTAAHCVYDNEIDEFASNWMFIPNYDAAPAPLTKNGSFCSGTLYGCWTAEALVVHDGFASEPGFTGNAILHDFAFAVLGAGGKSNTLVESLGTVHGIQFSSYSNGTPVHSFGYPHAAPYAGTDLVYCAGDVGSDNRLFKLTYKLGCDMTGGSSGGGWFVSFDEASGVGTLMSVNSYKYTNNTSSMYGPKFDSNTGDVYSVANSESTNSYENIVP